MKSRNIICLALAASLSVQANAGIFSAKHKTKANVVAAITFLSGVGLGLYGIFKKEPLPPKPKGGIFTLKNVANVAIGATIGFAGGAWIGKKIGVSLANLAYGLAFD